MKYEIKSIRIWSFLKITFFLNIFVGFSCGVVMAFFTASALTVMGDMPFATPYNIDMPTDFPIGALFIIYPIMGAIFSAVFLTIFEVFIIGLYNLFAKLTGGMEFDLRAIAEIAPAESPIAAQASFQPPPLPTQPSPPPPPQEFSAPPPVPESPTEPKSRGDFEPPKPPAPEPRSKGDFEPPQTNPDEHKPE